MYAFYFHFCNCHVYESLIITSWGSSVLPPQQRAYCLVFAISGFFFRVPHPHPHHPPPLPLLRFHSLVCAARLPTRPPDQGPGLGPISMLPLEPQQPAFSHHLQALAYFPPRPLLVFSSSVSSRVLSSIGFSPPFRILRFSFTLSFLLPGSIEPTLPNPRPRTVGGRVLKDK